MMIMRQYCHFCEELKFLIQSDCNLNHKNMKIALLLFAFTIFLIPTIASADVIPDNWLTIPICTKIENINLFPDYTF